MKHNLALQLDDLLIKSYKKLPNELKKLSSKIAERLDLPTSNIEHRFNEVETKELINWLNSTSVKNKEELINYVEKVHKYGDI